MKKAASLQASRMAERVSLCETMQRAVYGSLSDQVFPLPLGKSEASLNPKTNQRRYLWTDAFGVINYVSLAVAYREKGDEQKSQEHLQSASRLIDSVMATLGTEVSPNFPMAADEDGRAKGLRIGKLQSRQSSDAGMAYDGMYWHYVEKFIYALCCYAATARDRSALDKAAKVHIYLLL
jgi:hypothetical protein